MSEFKAVQVRLPEEAFDRLRWLAELHGHTLGEEARLILSEALLGKGHALKVKQERFAAIGRNN